MYNQFSNTSKKRHRPRKLLRNVEKHQVKLRQDEHSKFVTGKRLSSKHSGIFSRGQISSTVLRDTIFKEDIKARAEANLSKILQLARGDSSKPENLFGDNTEDGYLVRADPVHLPDPIANVVDFKQLNQISPKSPKLQLNNVNVITSQASQEGIEIQQGVSSIGISENSSDCIPYSEFAMKIKLHLNEATAILKKKYNIDLVGELTDLLQDTIKNRLVQLTPPSGGKGISHYLENAAKQHLDNNEIIGRPREAETLLTSSSSSGISPNFDASILSTSKFSSPLGVIRHYERNLVKHSCTDKKSLHKSNHEAMPGRLENSEVQGNGSQRSVAWLRDENIEKAKLLTPAVIISNQIQKIPKTVLIDPVQYLQRYEKSSELNIVNNNKGKENIFQLTTGNATNTNIHDGNSSSHQHEPLNLDNHRPMYNINEHGNYDSLNKNSFKKNKYEGAVQSHYVNNNRVSKYYSEPFPESYRQLPDLQPQYVNNYSASFPTTHQIMLLNDHQLQPDYKQFQEPILQRPPIENALYRSRNHLYPKDLQHNNNHLRFSQIVKSRDIASPNLFSPAKVLPQSQYDSRSSQMSLSKPLYQRVDTQHPSYHVSNGSDYSHNLLKPIVIQESNMHHFQNQTNCQTWPKEFLCEYNLPQESTFAGSRTNCHGAYVTSQRVPLHSIVPSLPSHSAQPIFSADLINFNGEHILNGENQLNHSEVPSSTSRFFTDLIDFYS